MAMHPDASWNLTTTWLRGEQVPCLAGTIYLGCISRTECDLMPVADSADEDSLLVNKTFVQFVKAGIVYRVKIEALQPMARSDIQLLKKIGKIVKTREVEPRRVRTRSVLMCGV